MRFCITVRYISGTVGIVDTAGNVLDNATDMGDQTTNALARVGQVLAECGASPLSILNSVSNFCLDPQVPHCSSKRLGVASTHFYERKSAVPSKSLWIPLFMVALHQF